MASSSSPPTAPTVQQRDRRFSNSGCIQITGGSSGSGNGVVTYTVAVNTNTLSQTGSITAAGQTFTITEAAPSCNVAPTSTTTNFSAARGSAAPVDVAANEAQLYLDSRQPQ